MRITNGQIVMLEKCITESGLILDLFNKVRKDGSVWFQFTEDYYTFELLKKSSNLYLIKFKSIYDKKEVSEEGNWDSAFTTFKSWCEQIRHEGEMGAKMYDPDFYRPSFKMSPIVKKISPKFAKVFSQAFEAEQHGLDEICGIGYRKAFEFLIKDYSMSNSPREDHDKIKGMGISDVVTKYITDVHINLIVKRAIWLGNDHAHYQPTYKNKTINHLKELIYKTISWIEAHEELRKLRIHAEKLEKQMPYKKKA